MTSPPLHTLSIAEAGVALRAGRLTAQALTEHALARIATHDDTLRAFIRVTAARAREDAARADQELRAGLDRGPLHGIPYGLKDIFDVAGIPTTCNSRLRLDHVPAVDSEVEARLKAGGAVLLGKLTTHEFALGGPGFDLPFPPARNPWNPAHFTGGSSSGSGSAVAAGLLRVALGSDTGGSIRSPATHCGVVGLKPTYGRVSRRGVFPLSFALDHCGPLTWSVEDAALVLGVIAGYDPLDPSSVEAPAERYTEDLGQDLHGLRLGYARRLFSDISGVSPEVLAAMDASAQTLAKLGAVVEEVVLPDFELFKACGRIIMTVEAYAIHEQDLKTRPRDFGRYTYQRVTPAAALTAADLTQAFRLRQELTVQLNREVLSRYDALLTTTALTSAPRLDEFPHDWPPPSLAVAVQTVPFNVTGNPALVVPAGFFSNGLPLGMQLVGRPFDERTLFRVGAAFEARVGVTHRRPPLEGGRAS
ncbi:amidase [Myxococcus sp. K15C18031901]|uniref:amidase n=1 Tax=Myxococcus dinghuensis TaxID=2906761 RepID=UPI0020A76432|nr:amidase family protein [Myxococcus dinghuensis]MCP3102427.1 amidase [Myxococcus dinghuensis]